MELFWYIIYLICWLGTCVRRFFWYIGGYTVLRYVQHQKYLADFYLERQYPNGTPKVVRKANKSLTPLEVIGAITRRQKTEFYAPLHSFWPLFISFSLGLFLILLVASFHNEKIVIFQNFFLLMLFISLSIAIAFWFSLFYLEKRQGNHNFKILDNIEMGFFLFLFTEALCFISLFWVFLHSTLASSIHVGLFNPGEGVAHFFINETVQLKRSWDEYYFSEMGTPIYFNLASRHDMLDFKLHDGFSIKVHVNFYDKGQLIDPYNLPLLNTFILLSSAASLNLSHLALKKVKNIKSAIYLLCTIFLGIFFVFVQFKEYKDCTLQYNDGIYAACFFSLTGLHGLHVIIGLFCLIVCFFNILFLNYSANFHQSFHYSILYWHFVDIIWILVYFVIYLWPSSYFFTGGIYAVWLDFGHYSIHFDKKDFERVIKRELFITKLNNNKNIIFSSLTDYNFSKETVKNSKLNLKALNKQIIETGIFWKEIYEIILSSNDEEKRSDLQSTLKMEIYAPEFYLYEWYNTREYFNYNLIKKDPNAFCFMMHIMHKEIFSATENCFAYDIKNTKKKMIFFCLFYLINEQISLTFIYYFMPYLFEYRVIRKIYKLFEFNK